MLTFFFYTAAAVGVFALAAAIADFLEAFFLWDRG
jgi:hypothetical protein